MAGALDKFEEFAEECEKVWFTFDPVCWYARWSSLQLAEEISYLAGISVPRMEDSWEKAKDGLRFAINFLRANAESKTGHFSHHLCW